MSGHRPETPGDAVFSGCLMLFMGIFMDFIMLMVSGYPSNLVWILFFIVPSFGFCWIGLGLYYRSKGLRWNDYFPWEEKRIRRNNPRKPLSEEMPLLSGWWKICPKCETKANLDALECPVCGDAF